MDDNNLLMIVLALVFGFMLQGMMKNMCGGRLFEGSFASCGGFTKDHFNTCNRGANNKGKWNESQSLVGQTLSGGVSTCMALQSKMEGGKKCRNRMCGDGADIDVRNCGPFKDGYYVDNYYNVKSCANPPNPADTPEPFWSHWLRSCVKHSSSAYNQVCPAKSGSYWVDKCPDVSP